MLNRPIPSPTGALLSGIVTVSLLSALSVLSGCSSSSEPGLQAGEQAGQAGQAARPLVYLQSRKPALTVATCLADRLPDTKFVQVGRGIDLFVNGEAWLLNVSDTDDGGALLSGRRGPAGDSIEPEVRFAIARCML